MAFNAGGAGQGAIGGATAGSAFGPWGTAIGAVAGGLLGGLTGGGKKSGMSAKKAKHHQLDYDRRRIAAIVEGAKDAGIHPLAAIGASSGAGGFAAPVGGGSNFGLGDAIGAGLRDLGGAFSSLYEGDQDRLEREEDRAYNESMRRRQDAIENLRRKEVTPETRLTRENMQLQNDLLRMDIATSRTRLANMRAAAIGGVPDTVITPFQNKIELPFSTDAATMQNEFGEAVGDTYGWLRWLESQLTNPRTGEGVAHERMRKDLPKIPKAGSWKPLLPQLQR